MSSIFLYQIYFYILYIYVILLRTDSTLCRKELTVHLSAPNSFIRSCLQPCTNSLWGDESEAAAPIVWLYQAVDAQKEEVFFPDLLISVRRHELKNCMESLIIFVLKKKLLRTACNLVLENPASRSRSLYSHDCVPNELNCQSHFTYLYKSSH